MLLRDLIQIPESLGAQDFVLKLTDGVTQAAAKKTLAEYVITDTLAGRFDEALELVRSALGLSTAPDGSLHQGPHQKGRAVYLHGSFGSGKSHFMAVLHRLLVGDQDALSRPELASVVAKHGSWLGKKNFLLVPYHMLGANSIEERVFDGYVRVVQREHPEAKLPALFDTDAVVRDAEGMRGRLGDETFLKLLGDDSAHDGWGDYSGGAWTLEQYEAARDAAHSSSERQRLATALVERVFPSQAGRSGTVEFAVGLEQIATHAKGLGYDAIVLFLDELILWLASRASTPGFIEAQVDKLVNLVESNRMERPIPLIGFIARQRDLRSLIQRDLSGAEELDIDGKLSHHEMRFAEVRLETTDLPEIASRRLLAPRDDEAARQIGQAFRDLTGSDAKLRETLLGQSHTLDDFRKVYPFSPVLVDALVQAASMLQRDRTALRAMLQLLVERRETLELGEIIPVGDLYDVISRGNDAVSGAFREAFERARKLYDGKLVPLLEKAHGLRASEVEQLDWNEPQRKAWRTDDRILKTLLVANLVGNVPALDGLDAKRIATLNHGTITSRIPGQEGAAVLRRLREWATSVPEIRITGDEANPQITLELHGVDVEGVLVSAAEFDTHGNRVQLVRELLTDSLELGGDNDDRRIDLEWRGTKRRARVLIANVANLPLTALDNDEADWKVVVDVPLDDQPDGATRDQKKLNEFRSTGRQARTLVWAPLFLNATARKDLGRLVKIDRVLRSDQSFEQHSQHLSSVDRAQAKSLLRGQRDTLRHTVRGYLLAAYGLSTEAAFTKGLDDSVVVPERFVSLDAALSLRPPGTGNLRHGLEGLVEQGLEFQFPKAPKWKQGFSKKQIERAFEIAMDAAGSPQGRAAVDSADLKLMHAFADPLELGRTESAFVLRDEWRKELERLARQSDSKVLAVGDVWAWLDSPEPRGLVREVRDLMVQVWAAMSERSIERDGQAQGVVKLGDLRATDLLRPIPLPSEDDWRAAQAVAGAVFGVAGDLYRTGANVGSLVQQVQNKAREQRHAADELAAALDEVPSVFLPREVGNSVRLADALSSIRLFEAVREGSPKQVVEVLAGFTFEHGTSPASVAKSWNTAEAVRRAIKGMNWELLKAVLERVNDPIHGHRGAELVERVCNALRRSELVVALAPELEWAEREATALITKPASTGPIPTTARETGRPGAIESPPASQRVASEDDLKRLTEDLRRALSETGAIDVTWTRVDR